MELFQVKPNVYYGKDALHSLKDLNVKKVFIVTDENMVRLKVINHVTDILDNMNLEIKIFSEVKPDPTDQEIISGMIEMNKFNPDCIIALGGGSPIDACKAMLYFTNKIKRAIGETVEKQRFVVIPTTSGTGSEVTTYSVITANGQKIALSDEEMLPDIAILDPEFIRTLPKQIIADTGMDVLTHAIEAYVSLKSSLFTDSLAIGAIKTVFNDLVNNYDDPELETERINMQLASCMAGIAFSNSSLGINHSIAHAIGAKYHVAHGKANAVIMPKIILFNSMVQSASDNYDEIAKALDFNVKQKGEGAELLARAIDIRKAKMGIPAALRDMGISKKQYSKDIEDIMALVDKDICTEYNPRKFNRAQLRELLENLY